MQPSVACLWTYYRLLRDVRFEIYPVLVPTNNVQVFGRVLGSFISLFPLIFNYVSIWPTAYLGAKNECPCRRIWQENSWIAADWNYL